MSCLLKISLFHTSTLHHILSTPDSLRGWVKRKCSPQEEQIQIETWGRNEGRDSVCPFSSLPGTQEGNWHKRKRNVRKGAKTKHKPSTKTWITTFPIMMNSKFRKTGKLGKQKSKNSRTCTIRRTCKRTRVHAHAETNLKNVCRVMAHGLSNSRF